MARRLFLWTQERAAHHSACGREAGRAVRGCGPAAVGLAFGEEGSVDRLAEIHAPHQQRFSPRTTPRRATNTGTRWVTQFKHPRRGGVYSSRCHA